MANKNLSKAKDVKNDEFYTQYDDIPKEVNAYLEYDADVFRGKTILLPCDDPEKSNFTKFFAQNFERFGLEKLVSTSYAPEAKAKKYGGDMSLYSYAQEHGAAVPKNERGRIYVLERGAKRNGRLDIGALSWEYLKGDGDFRSDEVSALRDEADLIVTNPPFSLFREFMSWVTVGKKNFLVIGNMNAVTYKVDGVFERTEDEMCGLDWGRLYEAYHKNAYNPKKVWERVRALYADDFVKNRRGIFEYILGGEKNTRILDVRVFDTKEAKAVYAKQTAVAEKKGVSNCPLCAVGHAANKTRIYKFSEMDADHVTAWTKGGATSAKNCQMLCKTHNRAKGNR